MFWPVSTFSRHLRHVPEKILSLPRLQVRASDDGSSASAGAGFRKSNWESPLVFPTGASLSNLLSSWPIPQLSSLISRPRQVAGIDQTTLFEPKDLADKDSNFTLFQDVEIHYKESQPFKAETSIDQGILGPDGTLMLGFPCVLLHGFGASCFSWERVLLPCASLMGAPAIAFDRPAFGLTAKRKTSSSSFGNMYSMEFSTACTLNFVDQLRAASGGKSAVLIAHSAGSLVAVHAALTSPEKIAALVLIAPAIFPPLLPRRESDEEDAGEEASDGQELRPKHQALMSPEPYSTQQKSESEKYGAAIRESQKQTKRKRQGRSRGIARKLLWPFKLLAIAMAIAARLAAAHLALAVFRLARYVSNAAGQIGVRAEGYVQSAKAAVEDRPIRKYVLEASLQTWRVLSALALWCAAQVGLFILWFVANIGRLIHSAVEAAQAAYTSAIEVALKSKFALWGLRRGMDRSGVWAVRNAWHNKELVDQHVLEGYTKPLKVRGWDQALLEFIVASRTNPPISRSLQDIACPVLVVTGDDDRLVPAWNAKRVAAAFPRAVFRVVAGCGHCPQEEKPAELLAMIREFLEAEFVKAGFRDAILAQV